MSANEKTEQGKIFALTSVEYFCGDVSGSTMLFSSLESARKQMRVEYENLVSAFPDGKNEWGDVVDAEIDEDSARVDVDADNKTAWNIAEAEVN